jgi:hypothetical protein
VVYYHAEEHYWRGEGDRTTRKHSRVVGERVQEQPGYIGIGDWAAA